MLLEADVSRCRLTRNPTRVSPTLDNPDALVQTVQVGLAGGQTSSTEPAKFTVAEVHRDRGLRMLDALIKTFAAKGAAITPAVGCRSGRGTGLNSRSIKPGVLSGATGNRTPKSLNDGGGDRYSKS